MAMTNAPGTSSQSVSTMLNNGFWDVVRPPRYPWGRSAGRSADVAGSGAARRAGAGERLGKTRVASLWMLLLMIVFSADAIGSTHGSSHGSSHLPIDVAQAKDHVQGLLGKSGGADMPFIVVSVREQKLYLFKHRHLDHVYPVSTSAVGVGSKAGSNRTPLGLHRIAQKFGAGEPLGMIFKSRRPTGQIAKIQTKPIKGDGDDVTTRIMWLEGMQPGINKGPGVDSHARYIYIHGTPEEGLVGTPESHGCVRMKNHDVIKLFQQVATGTLVDIVR